MYPLCWYMTLHVICYNRIDCKKKIIFFSHLRVRKIKAKKEMKNSRKKKKIVCTKRYNMAEMPKNTAVVAVLGMVYG